MPRRHEPINAEVKIQNENVKITVWPFGHDLHPFILTFTFGTLHFAFAGFASWSLRMVPPAIGAYPLIMQ
jgi:hypothetical protein